MTKGVLYGTVGGVVKTHNEGVETMKTKALVLFTAIYLAGCATRQPTAPTVVGNVGQKSESDDPAWLTLESNRGAIVRIAYQIFDRAQGVSSTISSDGVVVGPHTILGSSFVRNLKFSQVVQRITIQSALNPVTGLPDWSGVPARIVARLDVDWGAELLITNDELPDIRPVVFRRATPFSVRMEGYQFAYDVFGEWFNYNQVQSVFVEIPLDDQSCVIYNLSRFGLMIMFDTEHRLICFNFMPSQAVVRFLQENGVSVITK